MGLFRVDGVSVASSGTSYTAPSTGAVNPANFGDALTAAQTATNQALSTQDTTAANQYWATANQYWTDVANILGYNYNAAAASTDPHGQIATLDAQYGATFRGQGQETAYFDTLWKAASKAANGESQADAQYQVDWYKAQQKVSDNYSTLQSATGDAQSTALTNYTTSLTALINLELGHELGPGSHTVDQWMAAAKTVEKQNNITGDAAQIIDSIAKVNGYMDEIQNNPGALNLAPAVVAAATKDPSTYAFMLAAGVPVSANDPALKGLNSMQTILSKDPVLFTMLWQSGVKIWTDGNKVVANDPKIGLLTNGQYLHVTVNNQPVDETLLAQLVDAYGKTYGDNRPIAVATTLLPSLHLDKNASLQTLMIASDSARMQYGIAQWKVLTSGPNPNAQALSSFLNAQLNGFFDPNQRTAFWNSTGKSYFTVAYFTQQFNSLMQKPNQNDPNYYRDMQSTQINADKIGTYMQSILKDAPPEVARVLLDSVKADFSGQWFQSNNIDMSGAMPRFTEFYKGLSMAVALDPTQTAQDSKWADEIAAWLTSQNGPQAGILAELWDPNLSNFQGVKDTIAGGYGPELSTALQAVFDKNHHLPEGMAYWFGIRYGQGIDQVQNSITSKVNNQDYTDFMQNPDKVLTPFFQSFLKGGKVGQELTFQDSTQWRDIIGQTLNQTPNAPGGQQAADAGNYNVDWYKQGTPQWNVIALVEDWLKSQGADRPGVKVTALPFKYVSGFAGVNDGGLFLIDNPATNVPQTRVVAGSRFAYSAAATQNNNGPQNQEVIDGTAAIDAINANGGAMVDPNNVNFQWHYSDFNNFQDDNRYDQHGYIYLPTNFHLTGHNGQISPSDYTRYAAHIKTFDQWAMQIGGYAMTVAGVALMVIPGLGEIAGVGLLTLGLMGAGMSAINIISRASHGESWTWSNPEAQADWLNIAGSLLAAGRVGGLSWAAGRTTKWASLARFFATGAGATSASIGVYQTASATQSAIQSLNDPTLSGFDKFVNFSNAASGLVMIGASGLKVKPFSGPESPIKYDSPSIASPGQTGARAFLFWDAADPATRPAGGRITVLWTAARTNFLNVIGLPAFNAWVHDGSPSEPWWDAAVDTVKSKDPTRAADIQTRAQSIAGSRPVTPADEYQAIKDLGLGGEVGWEAFKQWLDAPSSKTSPKTSVTSNFWSQGEKELLKTGRQTFQRWRADQDFVNRIGAQAYKGYQAAQSAGLPADPWWTAAIDAQAKELWTADTGPKPATWKDPANTDPAYIAQYTKYFNDATANYGPQIGLKAYQDYNDPANTYRGRKPSATPVTIPRRFLWWTWSRTLNGPATLTYKTWDAASPKPPRLTTKGGDDVILTAGSQTLMKYLPWLNQNPIKTLFHPSTYRTFGFRLGIPVKYLQYTPTDLTVWTGAESAYRVHIGPDDFSAWVKTDRPLGMEDTYFNQANQFYKNLIGTTAYGYTAKPSTLPNGPSWLKNFVGNRIKKGATATFWTANETAYNTAKGTHTTAGGAYSGAQGDLNTAAIDWTNGQVTLDAALDNVGRNWLTSPDHENLTYWKMALWRLKPEIDAEAIRLQTADSGRLGGPDAYRPEAIKNLISKIAKQAYEEWKAAPKLVTTSTTKVPYAGDWNTAKTAYDRASADWTGAQTNWTNAQATWSAAQSAWTDAQTAFGGGSYDLWSEKPATDADKVLYGSKPQGLKNQAWVIANRRGNFGGVVEPDPLGLRTGQWFKDLWQQSRIQFRQRQGLLVKASWNQHFTQMGQAAKFFGLLYGGTNLVGAAGWVVANYFSHEVRKTKMGDPQTELDALLANPKGYMSTNYEVQIFGLGNFDPASMPPGFNEASGDLMVFTGPGGTEFFHRIPEDLYNALKARATVVSSSNPGSSFEPWLLEPQANQNSDTKVFLQNGTLYVYQTVDLSKLGSFSPSDVNPLTTDPSKLPAAFKTQIGEQLGVQAYLDWLKAGSPQGVAGSSIWSQAQQAFMNQTGTAAYTAWVNAGRPTTGDNSYWGQALAAFQPQIGTTAQTLAGGGTPTQAQKNQAEQQYGPQIALLAFQNWVQGGSSNQSTAGVTAWKTGLPAFQAKISGPAFNAWASAGRPVQGTNALWKTAINQWITAGMPVMQLVDLRPPWRDEAWNVDSSIYGQKHGDDLIGYGFRDRWTWGAGPIEGWRLHANLELTWNYHYNTPTATTLRIGGPSPTQQGWSWDVRQQDTTLWNRFTLGFGTWEVNGAATGTQVYDVTGQSITGYTVMNGRIYVDTGNRNRTRLDLTGKYVRFRDTGFVEIGLGADFFKYVAPDNQTYNLNGYYEAQIYAPDFRSQFNYGPITNARGFQSIPPSLGIDPALQFTITNADYIPRIVNIPYLSGEKR
jgi:hypothetical protein